MSPVHAAEADVRSNYKRYKIETNYAPPIFKEPARFEPKVRKLRLAKMLIEEFFEYVLMDSFSRKAKGNLTERLKAMLDRPCIYGVFSSPLGGFKPIKERCTACMRCKQEYPDVIEDIVTTKEFLSLERFGMRPEDVMTLWYEAKEGKELVKGMGYRGSFAGPGWDSIWLDMSEIVRPTRDGKMGREYISTSTDIGRRPMLYSNNSDGQIRMVTIELPIILDCSNRSWLNRSVIESAIYAAEKCGTLVIIPVEIYVKLSDGERRYAIPLIDREFKQSELLNACKAFETENHADFEPLRYDDKVRIARINADGKIDDMAIELVNNGYDAIHLVFRPDGKDISNNYHAKDVIRSLHNRLVRECIRDEISIIATGGINMAEHVPKAILCGCDAVCIDTALHIALQSRFSINDGKYEIRPREFDKEWGAQRIANLLAAWHEQFIEALSAMGKRDGRRLRGDVGRGIFYEELKKEAFGDIEHA